MKPQTASVGIAAMLMAFAAAVGAETPNGATNREAAALAGMSIEQLLGVKIETVYAASKHEQKVTEAPSSVSIVTRDDIQQMGYRTLADVLRSVRGIYVTYDRGYNFIGVRGFNRPGDYGGRTLILIDGHRLNDPIFDDNFAGTEFPLDMDLVERVEVIRGPGSSLYGDNAFFGIVNVVTRRGRDLQAAEASASAGTEDSFSGRFSVGHQFTNGVELLLSGTYQESAGHTRLYFPEFQDINNGIAENLDEQRMRSVFASLSWGEFTFAAAFGSRDKQNPTAPYGTVFNDPNYWLRDDRGFVEARLQHQLAEESELKLRIYYDYYAFDSDGAFPYNYDPASPRGAITINRSSDHWHAIGGELQFSRPLGERQHLTAGTEFRSDPQVSLLNFDLDPPAVWQASDRSPASVGVYLQDEVEIRTNLILNAGLRYDWHSETGDAWNPRAGLIYNPDARTTFKLLYGEAYRGPNALELGYNSLGLKANPHLLPETIRTYEVIVEQAFDRHWRGSASLYWNEVNGLIDPAYDATINDYINANVTDAVARGFELELAGRWECGVRARLSYTYADAQDANLDQRLSNSPEHLAQFQVVVPLYRESVFAGLEVQAMSSRLTISGARCSSYAVANFTLFSRELVRNLDFSLSLYNLFDTHYADPMTVGYKQDSLRQDGRSLRCKLTYRF